MKYTPQGMRGKYTPQGVPCPQRMNGCVGRYNILKNTRRRPAAVPGLSISTSSPDPHSPQEVAMQTDDMAEANQETNDGGS